MMQQIANFIVDHDPMMVLQRTHDTVRYIRWAWNKDHADHIDEDRLRLFLCDEHRGDLTEEQKVFARRCRDEMRSVYEEMCLRSLQCAIMLERGMVLDISTYGYKVRWEPNQKYITYTTPENIRCRDNKLFDQTLLRSSMEAYFDMGGCEYLESRIDATEYGELLPTVDDAVCGLISILDAMNTGDNDRFHLETLHHSKQEIRRILERGGKIDRTVEYAVDDEEEEYEQYHGFSMRM